MHGTPNQGLSKYGSQLTQHLYPAQDLQGVSLDKQDHAEESIKDYQAKPGSAINHKVKLPEIGQGVSHSTEVPEGFQKLGSAPNNFYSDPYALRIK